MADEANQLGAHRPLAEPFDERHDAFFEQTQPVLAARPADALRIGLEAGQRAATAGDKLALIRALLLQGMAQSALGDSRRDATLARALRLAEKEAEPITLVRAVNSQIVVDIFNGSYADALWRGQSILGLAHALRRSDLLWRLIINLGSALSLIGEFRMAIGMYRECLTLLEGPLDAVREQQRHQTVNNLAWSWLGVSRTEAQEVHPDAGRQSMQFARDFAIDACEGALLQPHAGLRASSLDTLVSVLLEMGEVEQALGWVSHVGRKSQELLQVGTPAWGIHALAHCRAELAGRTPDVVSVLERLRVIEALPGPTFKIGDLNAALNRCLYEALRAQCDFKSSLIYHRRWLQFEARTQSLLAREHALAVHRTLESLRGETEEFITHDLRNPLGAAQVQLNHLLSSESPSGTHGALAEARDALNEVIDAADRYLIILRLRHLRRADLKPIDLAELADDVGERLAPPVGAAVKLERDIEWGVHIQGDRIALLMLLQELLRASLACGATGTTVHCRLSRQGGHALLSLHGEDDAWKDLMMARLGAGSGDRASARALGAAMVARVAQLHDARIEWAAGTPGTVSWRFPLAAAANPAC
jgi:tetratricopeptide (TPR) repeat protein